MVGVGTVVVHNNDNENSKNGSSRHYPLSVNNESPRITMELEFQSKKGHNFPTLKEHLATILLLTIMAMLQKLWKRMILSPWEYAVNSNY